jgi:hypothetical protein
VELTMNQNREPHPAPAATNSYGQRYFTPQPDPADTVRNFGAPYEADTPAPPPQES